MSVKSPRKKPVLIFDGDCLFCRRWIRRLSRPTEGHIEMRPYQSCAADFPSIPAKAFNEAIQLVEPNGAVHSGADAAFRAAAWTPGYEGIESMYARSPLLQKAARRVYGFIGARRSLFGRITHALWGNGLTRPGHRLTLSLFLRGLGLVYFAAFASLLPQVTGLFGAQGVFPADLFLQLLKGQFGGDAALFLPSVFWLSASDQVLVGAAAAGLASSALVFTGVWPATGLLLSAVLYSSFLAVGGEFLRFQWDSLLVEAGVAALLVAPWRVAKPSLFKPLSPREPSRVALWCLQFLAFRLMFGAGVVKWMSGEPAWRDFTALGYHFQTQPLPNTVAWFMHQLPLWVHKFSAAGTLFIEGPLTLLVFGPRRLRLWAAVGFALLQVMIMATGNYGFFNLLALLLCLPLMDDKQLPRWFGRVRFGPPARTGARVGAWLYAALALPAGLFILDQQYFGPPGHLGAFRPAAVLAQTYSLVNPYGLFAIMTKERREIEIEGSTDGKEWKRYVLPYKPGPVERRPRQVAPHHPRLDWQLWFAALDEGLVTPAKGAKKSKRKGLRPTQVPRVLKNLMIRLLEGSPAVGALFEVDPFRGGPPPRQLRVSVHRYEFTAFGEKGWWKRGEPLIWFVVNPDEAARED